MTFETVIEEVKLTCNFDKKLGVMAKSTIVIALCNNLTSVESGVIKIELKKCDNLTQMLNVMRIKTYELSKDRTTDQISKFENQVERLIKLARL